MPKFRLLSLVVFGLAFALGIASCSQDTQGGESGALSLQLTIADDVEIDEVAWVITGGDMPSMGGTIDTSAPGATASIEVFGLPPSVGKDYTITMEAVATDDKTTCKGSEDFGIDVGNVTTIMVMLNCKRPTRLGAVRVNGEFNICAQLTKVVVSPLEIGVGYDIDVSAIAKDEEGDDIEYRWSNDLGAFGDPTARETTYTCGEVGTHDITITITDDGEPCEDSWTVPVECVDVDGVDCTDDVECDDQNDCTQDLCTAGSCLNPNEEPGATCDEDGGAVCDGEGTCVECNNNLDCDEGFVCNDNNDCVLDVECTMDEQCSDGDDCTQDLCTAGSCLNPNEEPGATCDQDGGAVCDGDGNCVACNIKDDCGTDEICFANECRSDPNVFCDTGLCVEDAVLRAECVDKFLLCLAENVAEEECVALSLLFCIECTDDADCSGPVELTTNGDFETGDGTGWSDFSGAGATFTVTDTQENGGVYSGNLAAGEASLALVKQANIGIGTVQPNSTVEISFDLLGSLSGDGGVVIVEFFSEVNGGGVSKSEILFGPPVFPTGTWTPYSYTVTTGNDVSGGVTLQLKAECGAVAGCGVDAYFDNVSVIVESSGGVCTEGVCESIAECAVDGDCPPTGNECTDAVCDAGSCGTSNNTNVCDGGNGTCSAGVCEPNAEAFYEQDFNQLPINPGGLIGDGWRYFINVFQGDGTYRFGYAGDAPQGPQISNLVTTEGGAEQEPQQLVVYSDYECCAGGVGHQNPTDLVETNVFQERTIGAADVGKTFTFMFQAKGGNLAGSTTANGFIKTLDPGAGFGESAVDRADTTGLPDTWGGFTVSILIPNDTFIGHILQFGFQTNASNGEDSANFYDNVLVTD